jgi:hypothetical protein
MSPKIKTTSAVSTRAVQAVATVRAVGWQVQGPALDAHCYDLVPIKQGTKRPAANSWTQTDFNSKGFERIYSGFGIGVKGAKTPGVDCDIADENVCRQIIDWCHRNIGAAPIRIGRAPRSLLVYRSDEPLKRSRSTRYRSPNGANHQIELIGNGGQFVAYAIHPSTGLPYLWPEQELTEVPSDELCEITQDDVHALFRHFDDVAVEAGWTRVEPAPLTRLKEQKPRQSAHELTAAIHDLRAAMSVIPIQPETYNRWTMVGMALYHATEGSDEGFELWDQWSSKGDKYNPDEMEAKWRSFGRASPGAVLGAKTIFAEANKADPAWRYRVERPNVTELGAKLARLAANSGQVAATSSTSNSIPVEDNVHGHQGGDDGAADVRTAKPTSVPKALTLADWLLRDDLTEPDFLLGEWLHTASRVLLTGPTGLGKTNLGLALAIVIAAGMGFMHWRGWRAARVLYIDGEMSRRLLRQRLRDAVKRAGGVVPEGLFILSREDCEADLPPLNTPTGQQFIDHFVSEHGGFDLIIFDNIQSLCAGDMREETSWNPVVPWTQQLSKRLIGQVWVHHTGHDESKSYGTSTRVWQMETSILMERAAMDGIDLSFSLKFLKAREKAPHNRTDFEPVTMYLEGDQWHSKTRVGPKLTPQVEKALTLLEKLILSEGTEPPFGSQFPVDGRVVKIDVWREWCRKGTITASTNTKSQNTAFARALETLQKEGLIGTWDGLVWVDP